jgi:hypothetical protein
MEREREREREREYTRICITHLSRTAPIHKNFSNLFALTKKVVCRIWHAWFPSKISNKGEKITDKTCSAIKKKYERSINDLSYYDIKVPYQYVIFNSLFKFQNLEKPWSFLEQTSSIISWTYFYQLTFSISLEQFGLAK